MTQVENKLNVLVEKQNQKILSNLIEIQNAQLVLFEEVGAKIKEVINQLPSELKKDLTVNVETGVLAIGISAFKKEIFYTATYNGNFTPLKNLKTYLVKGNNYKENLEILKSCMLKLQELEDVLNSLIQTLESKIVMKISAQKVKIVRKIKKGQNFNTF